MSRMIDLTGEKNSEKKRERNDDEFDEQLTEVRKTRKNKHAAAASVEDGEGDGVIVVSSASLSPFLPLADIFSRSSSSCSDDAIFEGFQHLRQVDSIFATHADMFGELLAAMASSPKVPHDPSTTFEIFAKTVIYQLINMNVAASIQASLQDALNVHSHASFHQASPNPQTFFDITLSQH